MNQKASMMNTRRNVTQKDIARACGVSDTVVSAILRGSESDAVRYSDETKQHVLDTCEELGYRLNRSARSLKRRRHGAVGIIGHTFGYLPEEFMQAFAYCLRDVDMLLNIELVHYDGSLPRLVATDSVDCLLTFESLHPAILDAIHRRSIPLVQANTNDRFGSGCVTLDEESAVRMSLQLAEELGSSRLAVVYHQALKQQTDHFSTHLRKNCFVESAVKQGFKTPLVLNIEGDAKIESSTIAGFLDKHSEIDFIFAVDESVAVACWHGVVQAGREVGNDIDLITFAHAGLTEAIAPPLYLLSANWRAFAASLQAMLEKQPVVMAEVSALSPIPYLLREGPDTKSPTRA